MDGRGSRGDVFLLLILHPSCMRANVRQDGESFRECTCADPKNWFNTGQRFSSRCVAASPHDTIHHREQDATVNSLARFQVGVQLTEVQVSKYLCKYYGDTSFQTGGA
eukprot:1219126-Amphidinium_carterae.2